MSHYARAVSRTTTPQSQPIPGENQIKNNAGGYVYGLDKWARLERFLILGVDSNTYYVQRDDLVRENAKVVSECIKEDGKRTVAKITEISTTGRAPKNSPAIFALALAATEGNLDTRRAAFDALTSVCRTGTHLFEFVDAVNHLRGWGRGLRKAVAMWYRTKSAKALAYQVTKYRQREGVSQADVLRQAHPTPLTHEENAIYKWVVDGWQDDWNVVGQNFTGTITTGKGAHRQGEIWKLYGADGLVYIAGFEQLQKADSAATVVKLINEYGFTHEMVPSQWKKEATVWEALLQGMPMTAMIRNLATMTRVGLLTPMSEAERLVIDRLGNAELLRKARIHPIAVLSALRVYGQGRGARSDNTWEPCQRVVDALDQAFYATFHHVVPTGKRIIVALDVSSSMTTGEIAGVPGLTPRDGSAAMALVTMATEQQYEVVGFTSGVVRRGQWGHLSGRNSISRLKISPRQRLDDVVAYINGLDFGGTDCALPMIWAKENKVDADAVIIYTDSETWAGAIHPKQALREYREKVGHDVKLIVVGMVANDFSIADPNDPGMLDVVGFDTTAPALMSDFIRDAVNSTATASDDE